MTVHATRLAIASGVLIVLLGGVSVFVARHTTSTRLSDAKVQAISNQPISQHDIQASITRGTAYLRANIGQVQPYQRLILDFLQRKFQLDSKFNAQVTPIAADAAGTTQTAQYQALQRIAYPNELVTSLPSFDNSMDTMVTYAANCDHIAFPSDYETVLAHNLQAGNYNTTHVLFAFGFMQDNNCPVPHDWRLLERQAQQRTINLAANPNLDQDLHYEAIVFTEAYGNRATVQPSWIRQIITDQHNDGSWGEAAHTVSAQDHQTVLALWALLEYAHPHAAKTPMIRRPG